MPRILISEPQHFYTFDLPIVPGAEVYIGTAPTCQLALPGVEGMAEMHACIVCQPQGYVISDLGSPYGTFANGVPFQSDYLMHGIEYRMGAAVITLAPDEAVPQQAVPMPQQAVQPAVQAAPAQAAPVRKPAVRRKPATAGAAGGAVAAPVSMAEKAKQFNRKGAGNVALFNTIYVIVLLAAAIYSGIALRHYQKTGNFLPGVVKDAAKK